MKKIDSTIKTIWTKSIQRDFRNNKIGFHESTLVSAFYFHLPPFIEQDRTLRIYLEYFYDKKRYDMVIFKKGTTKLQKNKWNRKFGDPWMIIEFKYHPKLEVDSANYDINKIRDLSNSISSIERIYFFSIDKNERIYRYIDLHGKWYENLNLEGRGVLEQGKWNFFIYNPSTKIYSDKQSNQF